MTVSWMNDSAFWVVSKLSGFTVKQTLNSWTLTLAMFYQANRAYRATSSCKFGLHKPPHSRYSKTLKAYDDCAQYSRTKNGFRRNRYHERRHKTEGPRGPERLDPDA